MNRKTVQWAIGVRNPAGEWVHEMEGRGRDSLQRSFSLMFTKMKEDEEMVVRRWNIDFQKRNAEEMRCPT